MDDYLTVDAPAFTGDREVAEYFPVPCDFNLVGAVFTGAAAAIDVLLMPPLETSER